MPQHAWMCLINNEYDWICRHIPKKQAAEFAKILNVSDAVYSIRSLYKLLSSCQIFKMERFAKRIITECRCGTRNFWGQGGKRGLWNWWNFVKISSKTQEKETPQGNILKFSLLDTLKTTFWMENLPQRCT